MKKRVKTKSQEVLEATSYVCRSYRGKTGRGGLFAPPPPPPTPILNRVKKVPPLLIGTGQTTYVNIIFLGKRGRLIADITETCDLELVEGYLVVVDFEKIFDSFIHNFVINALEHYGFDYNFIEWIKILLKNQQSFVINGCQTTKYGRLQRGAGKGDPISAYVFILVLEILSIFIRLDKNIDGINIFNHEYLYLAYTDDFFFLTKTKLQ